MIKRIFCMRKFYFAHIIAAALVLAASVLIRMRVLTVPPNDFMLIAWSEGRRLLNLGTVDLRYPYPLWTQILMLPFVLGSPELGAQLWFVCSLLLLSLSIVSLMDLLGWPIKFPMVIIVSLYVGAFGPVFTTLWLGQLNFVSLLSLVLLAQALKSDSWMKAGVVIGLSIIKPHLTFLTSAAVLAIALWQRRWRAFLGFGPVLCLFVAISFPFAVTTRQIFGGGVAEHLTAYLARTSTLWGLCLTLAPASLWIPAVVSCLLAGWLAYIWFDSVRSRQWNGKIVYLMGITTTVNLLILPYSWFYNQAVLILPLSYAVDRLRYLRAIWRVMWLVIMIVAAYFLPTAVTLALTRIYDSEAYQVIPVIAVFFVVVLLQWQVERSSKLTV
jgi:hypothetical protein